MAGKSKYIVQGIKAPGRINVNVDGRFQDIELHKAENTILEKLYNQQCPYVTLSPKELAKQTGKAEIQVKSVKDK